MKIINKRLAMEPGPFKVKNRGHVASFYACSVRALSLMLCLICICSAVNAIDYYAGETYTFSTPSYPGYFYLWSAENEQGDPVGFSPDYTKNTYVWTAPSTAQKVIISIAVTSNWLESCNDYAELPIDVLPLGRITVVKEAVPNDPQAFQFTGTPDIGPFTLYDDEISDPDPTPKSQTFDKLLPGTYSIEEIVPEGWMLTSAVCSDGSPVDKIDLTSGKSVTATFTNTKLGQIEITKVVSWNGVTPESAQSFEICLHGPSYPLGTESGACKTIGSEGGKLTWFGLMPGKYTITETNPGPSWTVSIPDAIDLSAGVTEKATVTNTHKLGGLTVSKTVDWNGAPPDDKQTFEICIKGPSYPSGTEEGACKTIGSAGGDLIWSDLIPGEYAVTETDPGSGWTVAVTGSPVTILSGGSGNAGVSNVLNHGGLTVSKTVDWNGAPPDDKQTFEICIKGPSYPSGTEEGACKTVGSEGGDLIWSDLIPGEYAVTEADPGSGWTAAVTGSPVTILSGGSGNAGVSNVLNHGGLTVSKTVDWNGAPPDDKQTFEICIKGPSYPSGTEEGACKTVGSEGGDLIWSDLIPGEYAVTETDPGSGWTAAVTGSPVTILSGGSGNAGVSNVLNHGGLTVSKTVDWNGAPPDDKQTFEICIKGPSYPLGTEEGACKTVGSEGGDLIWSDLIPGEYAVTETDPGSGWTAAVTGSPVTILSGGSGNAGVSNVLNHGGLTVSKTVDWNGAPPDDKQTFEICIKGPSYPSGTEEGACKTVGFAGGDLIWSDLIPGEYAVTETDPGSGWTAAVTGSPVTILSGGSGNAGVSNVLNHGGLTVSKTVDWNGAPPDDKQTFEICIKGPSYPSGTEEGACKTVGSAGGDLIWSDLIPGEYAVTEADPGSGWTAAVTGSPVTILSGGSGNAGVSNVLNHGGLTVSKTVDWNGAPPDDKQTFEICIKGPSYPLGTEEGACKTVGSEGGDLIWSDLIPGEYAVTETPLVGWSTSISGSPAKVVKGEAAVATVFNTCSPIGGSFKISGTKYEDLNGDVTKDIFDPGLSGWTIYLDANNNGVLDEGEKFKATDAQGNFLFEELTPGTYTVREVQQVGWTQTAPENGFADVILTVQDPVQIVDFGNWKGPGPIPTTPLVVTKTTSVETLIPNMETTFTITVENIGKKEIHDIKIIDELSPMLEFIPAAKYGDITIQPTIAGGTLTWDLSSLGSLQPGNSWTITYNAKLSPEACDAASSTTLPPAITVGDTKLSVMAAGSDPVNLLQMIDSLYRNKTKLEVKLESIKKERGTFDKTNATLESGIKSIAGTNYTLNNFTNISTGETLNEQLNATGFLVSSEYTRPAKYDLLTTTYGINGKVLSDFYNVFSTKETLKIEYDKPEKGYNTYTVRYYASGDTLILTVDYFGNVVSREYRKTPGLTVPKYLTNCATAYGNVGEQQEPVESNRACIDVGWKCEPAVGSISGTKFEDKNGNKGWDINEPGLGEWMINLKNQYGEIVKAAITSSSPAALGSYSINGISPGTYTLAEVPSVSSDWTQTYPVGNIYAVVVSETGLVTVTKSDQTDVPSTQVNFGNKFTKSPQESPLVVTKTTPAVTLIPNMETTFTITVENIGETEIHDIKIVDELSPMLEFIPPAEYGAILIQHTIEGGYLNFDLGPLGSLQPGNSWTITYKVKLRPEACNAASSITTLPPITTTGDTILNVMAAESDPANILPIIDALSRNKTKLEAKLESIKKQRDAFYKAGAVLESGIKSIAGTNYTLNNYTNFSTGEILSEQLNATGFLVSSEYNRPAKYDLLTTTYGMKGKVLSDFYNFFPTRETLKIEYDKPEKGYKTYTVGYYATGDTLILTVDPHGNIVSREYRRTPGLAVPEYLTNCATAYGKVGEQEEPVVSNRACANVQWSCQSPQPVLGLRVLKEADREFITNIDIGQKIKYTYTVQNTGSVKIVSLTIKDDKLGLVILNEPVDLEPGATLTYYGYYTVKAEDLNKPSLVNIVVATGLDPDGAEVVSPPAREEVKIIAGFCLTKTASPKVVKPGDYITYTIKWDRGDGYKIVDDYPSQVSFISASPPPSIGDNTWIVSGPGTITILVQVAQDIGNISFDMGQGVTGTGFVNVHNDIRTKPVILTNRANLYDDKDNKLCPTASADVNIGPPQAYAALKEHGSGKYASEDVIKYKNSNRSIEWNKSLTATYKPTTFSLPNNRNINYQTKWIEKTKSKNYATGGSTNEEYTYANRIEREAYTKLDENGSTTITDTAFEGVGHIGLFKKDADMNRTWNASQIFESQEDYVGDFKIYQMFDEYGKNVEYEKSVSGIGYVAGGRNIGNSQQSYESGTGKYKSEEKISTVVNYIAKDINLIHLPTSYTYTPTFSTSSDLLWNAGMWSKTPNSLISERFSSVENLDLQSTARGLNEVETEASVTGQADFRTVYKDKYPNSINEVDWDERYVGKFDIKRKIVLGGVAKYDRPHLSLSKMAKVDLLNTTFADYRITIENNGNRALGPIYVKDVFPTGTEYVTSSLRPAELTTSYANWTLLSMGIGSKVNIDLRLNITEEPSNLVNRVEAAGKYGESWTLARNFSVVRLNWLTCCPPQIFATKTVKVDALDPKVVWYSLKLKNREKYTMVAFLMDQLPTPMKLINSSLEPSEDRDNLITWAILDLAPGESRTITYRARAEKDGVYVNVAHIEAFSVDGPEGAAAYVEARIDLGKGGALTSSISSDWQPPTCFGLNCSGQIYSNDWIPCYTCGTGEPGNAVVLPSCASCINTGDDNLP